MIDDDKPLNESPETVAHSIKGNPNAKKSLLFQPNTYVTIRSGGYPKQSTPNKNILSYQVHPIPEIGQKTMENNAQSESDTLRATTPLTPHHSVSNEEKTTLKDKLTHPENWQILQVLPRKYRRPVSVLVLVVLVLLLIAFLKPSHNTVQSFEDANLAYQDHSFTENHSLVEGSFNNTFVEPNALPNEAQEPLPMPSDMLPIQTPQHSTPSEETLPLTPLTPAETLPDVQKTQTESVKPMEKTEPVVPVQQQEIAKPKATAIPQNDVFGAIEQVQLLKEEKAQTTSATKVITIRQGLTLMQAFRDNGLNIADVVAMSKVSNAGKALNNLKPNDKIYLTLDENKTVLELTLPNGGRFIRQGNRYQFNP